ncbi:MAG: hypothetical protein KatS3mg105_4081 [Gemmatales bacterium]|nr:MAG: hypothetical protein KatS3mg105_4081 [Gemmatales bacterium]
MRYRIGRLLQMIGLVIPLLGVSGNLARPDQINVWDSLSIAAIGIAVFTLGWLIQGPAST